MLQQTQVSRVREKYREFIEVFPDIRALARASLTDVLKMWSGLGYNRRAKYLHACAQAVLKNHEGKIPKDLSTLEALPGIGPYTARAVMVFAHNKKEVLIETNVRSVVIHHFFPRKKNVSEREIETAAKELARGQDPREWHAAMMDYGTYLKKEKGNSSKQSAIYTPQKKFSGSPREARGKVLRALVLGSASASVLARSTGLEIERVKRALDALTKDGLVRSHGNVWRVT